MDALSLDDAVTQLTAKEAPANAIVEEREDAQGGVSGQEDQAASDDGAIEEQLTESEASQDAEDADTPDEAKVGETEEDETVQPSIEPPSSWNAEQKAIWDTIPDDAKPALIAIEQKRNQDVAKAFAKAAERERAAQAKLSDPTLPEEVMSKVNQTLSIANAQFASRWDGVTADQWLQLAQNNPSEYTQLKAMYEADKAALDDLTRLQSEQAAKAEQEYLDAERAKAEEIFPELSDPQTQSFLLDTLKGGGFQDEEIRLASARELKFIHSLAIDAQKWRDSQKALQSPKKQAAPKAVKASSAVPANSKTKSLEALKKKAFASGRLDDMVAYELAKSGAS